MLKIGVVNFAKTAMPVLELTVSHRSIIMKANSINTLFRSKCFAQKSLEIFVIKVLILILFFRRISLINDT
jgi:hypothetical protein